MNKISCAECQCSYDEFFNECPLCGSDKIVISKEELKKLTDIKSHAQLKTSSEKWMEQK